MLALIKNGQHFYLRSANIDSLLWTEQYIQFSFMPENKQNSCKDFVYLCALLLCVSCIMYRCTFAWLIYFGIVVLQFILMINRIYYCYYSIYSFDCWNSICKYLQLVYRKQNGLFSSISKSFNSRLFKVQLQIVSHLTASLFRLQSLILNNFFVGAADVVVAASGPLNNKHRTLSTANKWSAMFEHCSKIYWTHFHLNILLSCF